MITVNCSEILPIQQELLIYVSDAIGAIPAIKRNEFVLSPIEPDEIIDELKVVKIIKEYLNSIREEKNFIVLVESQTIFVKSLNGEKMKGVVKPIHSVRTCCGI